MIEQKEMNDRYEGTVNEYVCDTQADLSTIPKGKGGAMFGSTARVIADGTEWVLSGSGTWKQINSVV